ncbi:MAG: Ig-like domain-containing protein [Chloroflexi bacterium]|nr:Ig-like domain-containing protein [Chloroflexota bacterium]
MKTRRWLPILIVVVLVIVLGAAYQQLIPRVVVFSPANETTGVFVDTPIRVEFSREMDTGSVAENLTIDPPSSGELVWDGNAALFVPDEPWEHGATITVRLGAEARSSLGLKLGEELAWSFTVGRTLLAYLFPADGPSDLYALDIVSGEILRFTNTLGVLNFDVDLNSTKIYYSAVNQEGGSDLFMFDRAMGESDLLLECGFDLCSNVQVHPNLPMLAYTRIGSSVGGGEVKSQVWLLSDLATGETEALVSRDETKLPQWSSSGWLSYYHVDLKRFVFLNPDTGERVSFANKTGEAGTWLPAGGTYITTQLFASQLDTLRGPSGEAQNAEVDVSELETVGTVSSHLISFDLQSGRMTDLTRNTLLEDTSPSFSPNGRLVALARKYIDASRWIPGRQIWLMSADGSETFQLTYDLNFKHTAFAWHPSGQNIAFVRFNQILLTDPPELWVVDTDGRNAIQLIIGGYAPQWIP